MKEQSVDMQLLDNQIPTSNHHTIMTQDFLKVYNQALQFSNLEVNTQIKFRNVSIYQKDHMHEVYTVGDSSLPHLVLLHGYGGTSLTYIRMFQHLKDRFQVHALDTFGIGLSSRGDWKDQMTIEEAGKYFIEAIEEWRKKVGIKTFILAGHSFGGYLATLYFQKYQDNVKQLILISPAGVGKFTDEHIKQRARNSRIFFCLAQKIYNMNIRPSKIMNVWWVGSKFVDRILKNRLRLPQHQQVVWRKYLRHVSGQDDCSQKGFYTFFKWPLQPERSIETILVQMKIIKSVDILFGDTDWMNQEGAHRLKEQFKNVKVHTVENAGHQLIFDNPPQVAATIKKVVI